jgi:Spy/CpxP family protein refolding chaperone
LNRPARLVVLALLGWTLLPMGAMAQQRNGPPRDQAERARLEERVRAEMGRLTRERLGLDEAAAQRLSDVMGSFEGRRRELFGQEQEMRQRVDAVLRAGAGDQNEAREVITRMWELRAREAELFREEQEALLGVLTPVQLLRLQELREDFGQRIRALGGGRGGRGAPPGSGTRGGRQGGPRGPSAQGAPGLQPTI